MTIIKADKMTVGEIKDLFLSTKGEEFEVVFKKKDGTTSYMTCTTDIASHLVGGNSTLTDHPNLFVCYSTDRRGIRSIDLYNVVSAEIGDKHYVFNSELLG